MIHEHTYSDSIVNKKIAILGPYPPPLGGISIHIKRVGAKLLKQNNTISYFDTTKRSQFFLVYCYHLLIFLLQGNFDRVYYHTPYTMYSIIEFFIIIVGKITNRFTLVLVDHDCRYLYKKNILFKKIFNILLRLVDQQVLIGEITYQSYYNNNIRILDNVSIESSFLAPNKDEESDIVTTYSDSLSIFLQNHYPIISGNAYQLSLINNQDLYGFSWCIDLVHELKTKYPKVGLVFALVNIGDESFFKLMIERITLLGIEDNIYIFFEQKEFWPLIKKSTIFVRPTISDSYGISVAEACYFNIPAIASDICNRPEKTILFKQGNKQDFLAKVYTTLEKILEI